MHRHHSRVMQVTLGEEAGLHIASSKGLAAAGALAVAALQVLVDAGAAEGVPALGYDGVLLLVQAHLHSQACASAIVLPS